MRDPYPNSGPGLRQAPHTFGPLYVFTLNESVLSAFLQVPLALSVLSISLEVLSPPASVSDLQRVNMLGMRRLWWHIGMKNSLKIHKMAMFFSFFPFSAGCWFVGSAVAVFAVDCSGVWGEQIIPELQRLHIHFHGQGILVSFSLKNNMHADKVTDYQLAA